MGDQLTMTKLFEGLSFRLAHGAERERALQLRREVYESELAHHGIDEFDAAAYHLIAFDSGGQLVAVTRVISPEQRPFELEAYVDLRTVIATRDRVAQIGGLAIHPAHRTFKRTSAVSLGLLKLALMLADQLELSDYVLWALPHLRHFYRKAGFKDAGGPVDHPAWGPLWIMHLDFLDFRANRTTLRSPMMRVLFDRDAPNFSVT